MIFTINDKITKEDIEVLIFTYLQQQDHMERYNNVIDALNGTVVINKINVEALNDVSKETIIPQTTVQQTTGPQTIVNKSIQEPIANTQPKDDFIQLQANDNSVKQEETFDNDTKNTFTPKVDLPSWEDDDDFVNTTKQNNFNAPEPTSNEPIIYQVTSSDGAHKIVVPYKGPQIDITNVEHNNPFIKVLCDFISEAYEIKNSVVYDSFESVIGTIGLAQKMDVLEQELSLI